MSETKQKKTSQLISAALHHQEFLNDLPSLNFNNHALTGFIITYPHDRNDLLDLMGDHHTNFSVAKHADYTPLFIPGRKFKGVIDEQAFDFKLGYSSNMDKINDGGDEVLSLILLLNTGHTPIGFFKITLTHTQSNAHDHMIQITLDQILIDKKKRNRTNWIDLTNGTVTFLSVMLECLLASAEIDDRLSIYLSADLVSKGGEKIGNIIFRALSFALEELERSYPDKAKCIDGIIADMG